MTMKVTIFAAIAGIILASHGCFDKGGTWELVTEFDIPPEPEGFQTIFGLGPGEACEALADCRIGLKCVEGLCAVVGEGEESSLCILSNDCGDELVCSIDTEALDQPKKCVPEGDGEKWDVCTTDKDCKKGMYCQLISFTGTCQEAGDGDVGIECSDTSDCLAGLSCGVDGRCGIMGNQLSVFAGATCKSSTEIGGEARALFEVPTKSQPLDDFYRLPFPNDIRALEDGLSLEGHPTPGPGVVGFDIAARLFKAMEDDLTAFGTNPVVFFRFSRKPELKSIKTGGGANIILVDITDSADEKYGKKISISWVASTGRGKYICQNYLAIYVPWARPLKGGHTYAAILTNTLTTNPTEEEDAIPFGQDDDFKTMLGDSMPSDSEMKEAWKKYTPLRKYLASQKASDLGVSKASIISAAVFTTYDPTERMAKFKEEMDTIALPKVLDAVVCDTDVISPCDDGLIGEEHKRGCFAADPKFREIQGTLKVPTFQDGDKPFIDPENGGGVKWDALGRPIVQGFEEVCFSFTIPTGEVPVDGWPVVLYGHGTGGNYRSHLATGTAQRLADMTVWNPDTKAFDQPIKMAVFGWDQVLHGPRIGPAPIDPDAVVFNFRNPRGALGNFYQGASEAMVLARLLAEWEANTIELPEIDSQKTNATAIQFLGHSQGGISGPLAMPFVDAVSSMVISGTGGGLVESLLLKTAPVDVRDGVIVALQDEGVGRTHPILALLQNYYDPVDPINYASLLFYEPYNGHKVRTFHPLGLQDEATPPKTMKALSQAMRAMLTKSPTLAQDLYDDNKYSGVQEVELPYKVSGGITILYPAPDQGGHYVIFHDEAAIRHVDSFLGTSVLYGTPTIPE